jgi:FkbM family methyltransferase
MLSVPDRVARRIKRDLSQFRIRRMMSGLKGIIHVGAHTGQERDDYAGYGLNVVWIEPIPRVFKELQAAIAPYPHQHALECLVLDKDGEQTALHISSNNGESSSVLDLALHRDVWPTVFFSQDISLLSYSLDTIIEREQINIASYDGFVLDTQGSELLVLKGAANVLRNSRMVKVEVADFESYAGCPNPEQISEHLSNYNFKEWMRVPFAHHQSGGRYYDIIYLKSSR